MACGKSAALGSKHSGIGGIIAKAKARTKVTELTDTSQEQGGSCCNLGCLLKHIMIRSLEEVSVPPVHP